ncbi:MAG: DUF6089 family protein [Candidatus Methylacidiphilales bacterium]
MKLIKPLAVFILITLNYLNVKAQQIEIGMLLGTSHYIGDLSDEKLNFSNTYFAASLFGRYNFSNKIAIKGMAAYGRVSGDDKQSNLVASKIRNLNFYTDIYEFSLHFEYNLLKNDLRNLHSRPFIPYVFGGIGVFKFNPKTELAGTTYELQALKTEGQGSTVYNDLKQYNLTEIAFPFGIGFRTRISDAFYVGFETGVRFTTTNYLDDVGGKYGDNNVVKANSGAVAAALADRSWEVNGQAVGVGSFKEGDLRSDKKTFQNDLYIISGITLTYIIRSKGQACPTFFN